MAGGDSCRTPAKRPAEVFFCCFFHTFGVNNILEGDRFMKKGIAMLLACALAFGLSACGKGEQMSEMESIQKQLMEM